MSKKRIALKKIQWDEDQTCIYTNGHVGPIHFLQAVKEFTDSGVSQEARDALILDDVEHVRFRRMSPSEARARGYDWGFIRVKDGKLKATVVFL